MGRRGEGIEVWERLNKLSKIIAGLEMDIENLKLAVPFLDNGEQTLCAFV
ncbi:MAG: hypothetical protein GQ523_00185 [Methanophagales archaeon]|nr:hypothetical protein [Methanophagales archaeon]